MKGAKGTLSRALARVKLDLQNAIPIVINLFIGLIERLDATI
jgi:hypothetical protein